MSERAFQKQLVEHLRLVLPHDVFMTYFPAGTFRGRGRQGAIRGSHLKAMGLVVGVPDLMIIHEGEVHFMELKAGKGNVSPDQVACHQALFRAGAGTAVVRTLAEAYSALDAWGVPTRIAAPLIKSNVERNAGTEKKSLNSYGSSGNRSPQGAQRKDD